MNKRKEVSTSVFDAVERLNDQDSKAIQLQQRTSQQDQKRRRAAQSQTTIYSSLVETRILLQRSLLQQRTTESNNNDTINDEDRTADTNRKEEDDDKEKYAVVQCHQLLAKLLHARRTLFPIKKDDEYDDIERDISSSTLPDYEMITTQKENVLSETLQSEFEYYQQGWKEVLNRRSHDARLHAGGWTHKSQFRVMDASFWEQVETTVQHEELRQQQAQQSHTATIVEEFDDGKVYQHLLKEFLTTTQNGDARTMAQQRYAKQIAARNAKSSMSTRKAQVDRKASKGRKIRYTEIPKLTNFTFPISRSTYSDNNNLDEDAWFRSLFGGAARSK